MRSLLSTLQYVLWPESGCKPIPLVDIIDEAAVKKAYQKALLFLHPDKLQQRGAAMHQKFIAEKVFDILQESWKEINSVTFG
uniref:J domain-containing protein n=1 Tax=Arundo donax TaxID=35708 RepID=A0A0A9F6M8_ARUDO